jgi:hypothetical protein
MIGGDASHRLQTPSPRAACYRLQTPSPRALPQNPPKQALGLPQLMLPTAPAPGVAATMPLASRGIGCRPVLRLSDALAGPTLGGPGAPQETLDLGGMVTPPMGMAAPCLHDGCIMAGGCGMPGVQELPSMGMPAAPYLTAAAANGFMEISEVAAPAMSASYCGTQCSSGMMSAGALVAPSPPPPPLAPPLMPNGPGACPSTIAPAFLAEPPTPPPPAGPAPGDAELPSAGSDGHDQGRCKPCAFFHTKGCGNGVLCSFCHLCEPGEKKKRHKEKLASRKAYDKGTGRLASPLGANARFGGA